MSSLLDEVKILEGDEDGYGDRKRDGMVVAVIKRPVSKLVSSGLLTALHPRINKIGKFG